MNVLVTGGAGYIGSHVCQTLAQQGYHPITVDNLSRGHKDFVKWGPLHQIDISETAKISEIIKAEKIENVFHLAAYAYVGESVHDPLLYYQNNVLGSLSLLNAMKEAGARQIIFSSTCATYGVPKVIPIDENSPQNPINPYGKSKLMVENILREFVRAHHFSAVSLRYFNAAGADINGKIGESHEPETHLIPLVLAAAHDQNNEISIYGNDYSTKDGTCVRDYIHVHDLAEAHLLSMNYLKTNSGFFEFNLGTGHGLSVKEIIETAEKVANKKVNVKISGRREGDPAELVASGRKAKEVLDWNPRFSKIETIIETANNWHLRRK